ncbi:MAG: hypothetical protein GX896_02725 [Clostridiales bacterium]|nr:hypothetical protein [Clostridiales bacterium]
MAKKNIKNNGKNLVFINFRFSLIKGVATILMLILALSTMLLMTGCGLLSESDININSESNMAGADYTTEISQSTNTNTTSSTTSTPMTTTPKVIDRKPRTPFILETVEQGLLWESEGIRVTTKGLSQGNCGEKHLDILVENNSNQDLTLVTNDFRINDFKLHDSTSIRVNAGQNIESSIILHVKDLENVGIKAVGKIEIVFRTFKSSSYETVSISKLLKILTSAKDEDCLPVISGKAIYNSNGIKIIAIATEKDEIKGTKLYFYILNTTKDTITMDCSQVTVNGHDLAGYSHTVLESGQKAIESITLLNSQLKDNGITEITEIKINFSYTQGSFKDPQLTGDLVYIP